MGALHKQEQVLGFLFLFVAAPLLIPAVLYCEETKVITKIDDWLGFLEKHNEAYVTSGLINVKTAAEQGKLSQVQRSRAIASIPYYLADKDKYARMEAISALGKLNAAKFKGRLEELLKTEKDSFTRSRIPAALAETGDKGVIPVLEEAYYSVKMTSDENAFLMSIMEAVASLKKKNNIDDSKSDLVAKVCRDLAKIEDNEKAVPMIYALGSCHDARAVKPLLSVINSRAVYQPEVRGTAAYQLGVLGSKEATFQLCKALDDPEQYVRMNAVDALIKLDDPRAQDAFITALNRDPMTDDESLTFKTGIAAGLAEFGNVQALEPIFTALQMQYEWLQSKAGGPGPNQKDIPRELHARFYIGLTNAIVAISSRNNMQVPDSLKKTDNYYERSEIIVAYSVGKILQEITQWQGWWKQYVKP